MTGDRAQGIGNGILVVVAALVGIWALSHILRAKDPNVQLVRTVQKSLALAEKARREAEVTRRTSSTVRVVALVAGVAVPLAVAYLIYRLRSRRESGAEEILGVLERERLLDLSQTDKVGLLKRARLQLEQSSHGKEDGQSKN